MLSHAESTEAKDDRDRSLRNERESTRPRLRPPCLTPLPSACLKTPSLTSQRPPLPTSRELFPTHQNGIGLPPTLRQAADGRASRLSLYNVPKHGNSRSSSPLGSPCAVQAVVCRQGVPGLGCQGMDCQDAQDDDPVHGRIHRVSCLAVHSGDPQHPRTGELGRSGLGLVLLHQADTPSIFVCDAIRLLSLRECAFTSARMHITGPSGGR